MNDIAEAYVNVIQVLLLTAVPVLLILTIFSWFEVRRLRPYRLPLILALSNTVIGACVTWLAWTILYYERVGPVPDMYLPLTATSILILCLVPWLTTGYLFWLEATRKRPDDGA